MQSIRARNLLLAKMSTYLPLTSPPEIGLKLSSWNLETVCDCQFSPSRMWCWCCLVTMSGWGQSHAIWYLVWYLIYDCKKWSLYFTEKILYKNKWLEQTNPSGGRGCPIFTSQNRRASQKKLLRKETEKRYWSLVQIIETLKSSMAVKRGVRRDF